MNRFFHTSCFAASVFFEPLNSSECTLMRREFGGSTSFWAMAVFTFRGGAKSTRRESGDERYIPLNDAAKRWLKPIRQTTGDCVSHSASKFGELWRAMTDKAEAPRIDNGLRHSAISYSLAAYPANGVALTSQWAGNSEKTIRKHYRRLLKPEQGKAWFAVEHV